MTRHAIGEASGSAAGTRPRRLLAAARLARALGLAVLAIVAFGYAVLPSLAVWWIPPIAVSFGLVGALIGARRPENPVGWLFLAWAVVAAVDFAAYHYAERALTTDHGSAPGADVAGSIAAHAWHAGWGFLVYGFLVFPTGRLLSPRWRWVARATAVTYAGLAVSGVFESDFLSNGGDELRGAQPLFHGPPADAAAAVFVVLMLVNLGLLLLAGASLLLRLHRSQGLQRQQVAWVVYAVTLVTLAIPVSILALGEAYAVALFPLIPLAAGMAILRRRLFDIDRVVNRTLVYGALTLTLGAVYLGGVLLLQLVLAPSSELAVAASTLAVAALFRPARARIQTGVDRRFYRSRYDAQRTLDAFAARLRDEVSLDALTAELRRVIADTVQPAHVSVRLRRPPR